jgi:hypothetical protein
VSCNLTSKEEFDKTTPVNPPTVNRNTNPTDHKKDGEICKFPPSMVAIHLKTFTPVGTAIIIVAAVK